MKIQGLINFAPIVFVSIALVTQTPAATITYTADNGIIANPERGYWSFNSNNFGSQGLPSPLSDMTGWLNTQRQNLGMTTIVATYGLSAWKATAQLPQNVLDLIEADFATARENGYKLIPRFSYCTVTVRRNRVGCAARREVGLVDRTW